MSNAGHHIFPACDILYSKLSQSPMKTEQRNKTDKQAGFLWNVAMLSSELHSTNLTTKQGFSVCQSFWSFIQSTSHLAGLSLSIQGCAVSTLMRCGHTTLGIFKHFCINIEHLTLPFMSGCPMWVEHAQVTFAILDKLHTELQVNLWLWLHLLRPFLCWYGGHVGVGDFAERDDVVHLAVWHKTRWHFTLSMTNWLFWFGKLSLKVTCVTCVTHITTQTGQKKTLAFYHSADWWGRRRKQNGDSFWCSNLL